MNSNETIFKVFFSAIGTFLTYAFGCWDTALQVLIFFMVLDYTSGVISAIINKTLSSACGAKGMLKKGVIFIVVIVAVLLDKLTSDKNIARTVVIYFYIANEGISILENCGKTGLPLPKKLLDILSQLKSQ